MALECSKFCPYSLQCGAMANREATICVDSIKGAVAPNVAKRTLKVVNLTKVDVRDSTGNLLGSVDAGVTTLASSQS